MKKNRGQALLLTMVILGIISLSTLTLLIYVVNTRITTQRIYNKAQAVNVAEAGIDKVIWCLNNQPTCGPTYSGETTNFGPGTYTTSVINLGQSYTVTSTGYVNNVQKVIRTTIAQQSTDTDASFFYGVQVGTGGISLSNNAFISGNIFANGSVIGSNGSYITGDAILAPSNPTLDATSNPGTNPLNLTNIGTASNTLYLAQSFIPTNSDKIYSLDLKIARHSNPTTTITLYIYTDSSNNPDTNISGSGQQLSVTVPNDSPSGWESGWTNQIFAPNTNPILQSGIKYWLVLKVSNNNATKYWSVVRSADDTTYADGTAKLDSDLNSMPVACIGGCDVAFRINLGGIKPTLDIPSVNGTAYADTIDDVTIGTKAYYQHLSGTVKAAGGTDTCTENENGPNCFDNSTDQTPQNFPISDAIINQMEAQATEGGTESSVCNIPNGTTIGPKKYNCDVTLNGTVTLNGHVWINGNLTITNNAILKLSAGYGSNSGVIIADYISDQTSKGKITLSNNGNLCGTDCAVSNDTYIMAISTYKDPLNTTSAIEVANNLSAGILFAPNGILTIKNNASLKEVTAQRLVLENNASVVYESGLADVKFSNGPGGTWEVKSKTWQEL